MNASSNFADRIISAVSVKHSFVVVGLDPQFGRIPGHIRRNKQLEFGASFRAISEAILEFNRRIIDAIAIYAVAVKPQIAFYEKYGYWGVKAFYDTITYAKSKDLLVIADAKRGDIDSTAQAYSSAFLGEAEFWNGTNQRIFDADALTVNPYLGSDGIEPFKQDSIRYGKGIFVVVRTSNKSAGDIQDLETSQGKLYERVGELVEIWGEGTEGISGYRSIGAVVGATYPQEAEKLRQIIPNSFFLVPGYGTQGACANDVVSCFNPDGYGAVVNSSRALIFAYQDSPWRERYSEMEFDQAAVAATISMRDEINEALNAKFALAWLKEVNSGHPG